MFHNLPDTKETLNSFYVEVKVLHDCIGTVQTRLRRLFSAHATPGTLFYPMQEKTSMGFTWSFVLTHVCMQLCNEST